MPSMDEYLGSLYLIAHREDCLIVTHGLTVEIPVGDPMHQPLGGPPMPKRKSATPCSCGGVTVTWVPDGNGGGRWVPPSFKPGAGLTRVCATPGCSNLAMETSVQIAPATNVYVCQDCKDSILGAEADHARP